MIRLVSKILLCLLGILSCLAQNGDRKDHSTIDKIVPGELIPSAPVLSVDDALKTFTIAKGFTIEAVAAEPLIEKPVALAFDPSGRMWVCEMRGYMTDIDGTGENQPTGRIAILEDSNGDGKIDKRSTFLDHLVLPRTIAIVPGGVLFGDQEKLYFVKRNGDQAKGDPIIIDHKFIRGGNVEHKTNGLMTNIDNWIYNAKSNVRLKFIPGENRIIKEKTHARGQWGISHDNIGRLFHNSNSTLLVADRLLPNLLLGNPAVKMKKSISAKVGNNRVYPVRVTPGVNRAYISTLNGYKSDTIDPKTFKLINATGACGPVIYRGDNFPAAYQNHAFICESAAQLVKMIKIETKNGKIKGTHPLKDHDFLTSTDERFRPVNLYNAPDGSLYLLDMYHGIIQHSTYMTTYLREQTLSRGLDGPSFGHGRIYRIRATDKTLSRVPDLANAEVSTLINKLNSPIGEIRDIAQAQLIARQIDPQPLTAALSQKGINQINAIHLIWTLEGLGKLNAGHLEPILSSTEDQGLISSVLYAALSLPQSELQKLTKSVSELTVQAMTLPYQARVLASTQSPTAQEALVKILLENSESDFLKEAAISGLSQNATLFAQINGGRFHDKDFNQWISESKKGPQKQIDPETLLQGNHLISFRRGKELYNSRAACIGCHGADGDGLENLGPQLDQSDWVTGSPSRLVKILLHGLTGPIKINGKEFKPLAFMPGLAQNPNITDQDIADLATFIRANWNNRAPQIRKENVRKIRQETKERSPGQMYTQADFPFEKTKKQ